MSEELELVGKFKSAEGLRLSQDQYCGLVKTLAYLEGGRLSPASKGHMFMNDHYDNNVSFTGHFNMGVWKRTVPECGTVCCIGGTAELLGDCSFSGMVHRKDLEGLFSPHVGPQWNATPKQAAVALRSFLETGHADWKKAMASPA